MNESTQRVNCNIEYRTKGEYHNQQDRARDAAACQRAQCVEYLCNNACCKPQRQQSGIGKHIRQIACDAVKAAKSACQLAENAFFLSAACQQNTNRTDDCHNLADADRSCAQLSAECKQNNANQQQIP